VAARLSRAAFLMLTLTSDAYYVQNIITPVASSDV
jgi:hypothetical protein